MYKLLLVDDEPIIREGLERMIDWEKLSLKMTASCPNAIAALDSMTDDMPDILLTDIRLPGMVFGAVLRSPRLGAALSSVDDRRARPLPGYLGLHRVGGRALVAAESRAANLAV